MYDNVCSFPTVKGLQLSDAFWSLPGSSLPMQSHPSTAGSADQGKDFSSVGLSD